jgi:hypothetical protein
LEQHRYAFTEKMLRRILGLLGFGDFDWWNSTLPEAANGWCAVTGGTKVAISVNVAARKLTQPIAAPSLIFDALAKRPLDDPITVVAETVCGQEIVDWAALDTSIYQRIHFHLIDARYRIKSLENALQEAEARKGPSNFDRNDHKPGFFRQLRHCLHRAISETLFSRRFPT